MPVLDDTALVVAVAAGVVAVIALAAAVWLALELRKVRRAQTVLLPEGASDDLLGRQADLIRSVASVERQLATLEGLVEATTRQTTTQLASSLRLRGLVRYDAYSEMGGQQSWSVALLDEHGTGAVISCLHARDHARIYLKEVVQGAASQRLSPEEQRSILGAIGEPSADATPEGVSEARQQAVEGT